MPIPVSITSNQSSPGPPADGRRQTAIRTPPCSVNLIALPTRLSRICCSRSGSLMMADGSSEPSSSSSERPLARARSRSSAATCCATEIGEVSESRTSSPPASIFDRSSMSLISASRWWPLRRSVSIASLRSPSDRPSSASTSV